MEIDTIRRHLAEHSGLRMPVFEEGASTRSKIEALEDYLGEVAVARGDLEEARLWADRIRHDKQEEWDRIEGWEMHASRKATGPQITEAKRRIDPVLYSVICEAKWLVLRLTDQIKRLEKDEDVASRRYTMLS